MTNASAARTAPTKLLAPRAGRPSGWCEPATQQTTIGLAGVIVALDGDRATGRPGDRATGRAAWMHTGKNAEGRMTNWRLRHYEDDLVKANGEWLFARRRIYNEGNAAWAAPPGSPAVVSPR